MPIQAGNLVQAKRERVRMAERYYAADPPLEISDLSIQVCGNREALRVATEILERQADLKVFRKTNLPILVLMAQAVVKYDRMNTIVDRYLTTVINTGKAPEPALKVLRPWLDQMEKERRYVTRMSTEFGMTARSRAEIMNMMVPVINSEVAAHLAPRKVDEGDHDFYE